MPRVVWWLLLFFVFSIPWEYSLDLGEPLGNIARIVGLLLLLLAPAALLQKGCLRTPGPLQWLVLAFYLWFCLSYFWTIEPQATLGRLRAFIQEMMIVWLTWEFAETPEDLRNLLRAWVAGSLVLAVLALADFAWAQSGAVEQIRFAASGHDPNDVARLLDLTFPLAALLWLSESQRSLRLLAAIYLPLGLIAVLLTASRGGLLVSLVALAGCGLLMARGRPRRVLVAALALPPIATGFWIFLPTSTLERLATIPEQLQSGDLNQRSKIWSAGWDAFVRAPWLGTGAGSFASAAGLSPVDTAHNTPLSIVVTAGLCGIFLAAAILALTIRSISQIRGPLRWMLATTLLVWLIASLAATVEENRSTWLLFALIALAGRLANDGPEQLSACFRSRFAMNATDS